MSVRFVQAYYEVNEPLRVAGLIFQQVLECGKDN
jgi:hypothetical protein